MLFVSPPTHSMGKRRSNAEIAYSAPRPRLKLSGSSASSGEEDGAEALLFFSYCIASQQLLPICQRSLGEGVRTLISTGCHSLKVVLFGVNKLLKMVRLGLG